MISYSSNGITEIGRRIFQKSVKVYVQSLLGAEADTRWSIVGKRAMSLQTQEQYRSHMNNLIVLPDVKELITDMGTAIQATHVILDMAIIPDITLVASKLVILKDPIPGYNNILLTTEYVNMTFGYNSSINKIEEM